MPDLIKKAAKVDGLEITDDDLVLINQHAIKEMKAEELFVFKVAMCDNEIDRDFEVFPLETLKQLADLYIGKTVIGNHMAKFENQVARIYSTEVIPGEGLTKGGEQYHLLIAKVYMVRTESNKDLITEISAGIKKEVSVGCAINNVQCSICGTNNRKHWCDHYPNETYEGKWCYFKLLDAKDAYELSFVAVPAQPKAGVVKEYGAEKTTEPEQKEPQTSEKDAIKIKLARSFIFIKSKGEQENE